MYNLTGSCKFQTSSVEEQTWPLMKKSGLKGYSKTPTLRLKGLYSKLGLHFYNSFLTAKEGRRNTFCKSRVTICFLSHLEILGEKWIQFTGAQLMCDTSHTPVHKRLWKQWKLVDKRMSVADQLKVVKWTFLLSLNQVLVFAPPYDCKV